MRSEKHDRLADMLVNIMLVYCNEICIIWEYNDETDMYIIQHNNEHFDSDLEFQRILNNITEAWFKPNGFENYKIQFKEN